MPKGGKKAQGYGFMILPPLEPFVSPNADLQLGKLGKS